MSILLSLETTGICLFSMLLVECSWRDSKAQSTWLGGSWNILLKAFHTGIFQAFSGN